MSTFHPDKSLSVYSSFRRVGYADMWLFHEDESYYDLLVARPDDMIRSVEQAPKSNQVLRSSTFDSYIEELSQSNQINPHPQQRESRPHPSSSHQQKTATRPQKPQETPSSLSSGSQEPPLSPPQEPSRPQHVPSSSQSQPQQTASRPQEKEVQSRFSKRYNCVLPNTISCKKGRNCDDHVQLGRMSHVSYMSKYET